MAKRDNVQMDKALSEYFVVNYATLNDHSKGQCNRYIIDWDDIKILTALIDLIQDHG